VRRKKWRKKVSNADEGQRRTLVIGLLHKSMVFANGLLSKLHQVSHLLAAKNYNS
jgi:hypoxanthine-guanine phosphoribosyltransferase